MNSSKKATLGALFLIISLLLVGSFTINQGLQIDSMSEHFINDSLKELDALQEMEVSVLRIRASTAEFAMLVFQTDISNGEQKDSVENDMEFEKELIENAKTDFERNMNVLVKTIEDDGDADVLEIQKAWREYINADEKLISALDSKFAHNVSYEIIENIEESEEKLLALLEDSIDNEVIEVTKQGQTIQKLNKNNLVIAVLGISMLVVATTLTTLYLLKKINKYKQQISEFKDTNPKSVS